MVHDQLTLSLKHPAFEEQGKAYFTRRELVRKSQDREWTPKPAVPLLLAMCLWPSTVWAQRSVT